MSTGSSPPSKGVRGVGSYVRAGRSSYRRKRLGHVRVKGLIFVALREAIARAGLPCEAFPEGLTVRIDRANAYEPDALVQCGGAVFGSFARGAEPDHRRRGRFAFVDEVRPGDQTDRLFFPAQPPTLPDPRSRRADHRPPLPQSRTDPQLRRLSSAGALRLDPPAWESTGSPYFLTPPCRAINPADLPQTLRRASPARRLKVSATFRLAKYSPLTLATSGDEAR